MARRIEEVQSRSRLYRVDDSLSVDTGLDTGEESYVQQQFKDELEINTIMRRYGVLGNIPGQVPGGIYADFTGVTDFRSAMERVNAANDGFMTLPAELREQFQNDPALFLDFVDGASEDDLIDMGLAPPRVPPGGEGAVAPPEVPPAA